MPHFKHKNTGKVVEVSEEFAEQVLRPQLKYDEVEAPVKVVAPIKASKKKSQKKTH